MSEERMARERRAWLAAALLLAVLLSALAPAAARAGNWIQVSCVNPDGSTAPSEGWRNLSTGTPEAGSNATTDCAPGTPMSAFLSTQAPAPVAIPNIGTSETLRYAPPSGSKLVGGSFDANLYGDSYGPNADGSNATGSGDAILFTPTFAFGGVNAFFQCAWEDPTPCSTGSDPAAFSGIISIPANRGGNLYIAAACGGNPQGGVCDQNPSGNAWTYAEVVWAHLLLFNGSSPSASGFGGSLLSSGVKGTADVSFTATDSGGPGVYSVTAQLDGTTVYSATPDSNSGRCVPVGTDGASGALMFDWQQPCPVTEFVDVPVNTAGLGAGAHQLTVSVTDAAQNTSTVLDQTIGIGAASTPPPRPHHVRAKLLIAWRYNGAHTRLLRIRARNLPRDARVAVRCSGHGCPHPRTRTAVATRVRRLWRALTREVLRAGDRETFTITAPGLLPERLQLRIRRGRGPVWKRL